MLYSGYTAVRCVMKSCFWLVGSLILACTLAAQESTDPSRGPDGGTEMHVSGIVILPVTGKPFSGRDSIEWTRHLEDGSVQIRHIEAGLARDSEGRIYRERRTWVPANSSQQSRLGHIVLLDPIAHTQTTCNVATRQCTVTGYHASTTFTTAPESLDGGKRYLSRESLGSDSIDGLEVVGTRETITISPGVVGNTLPLITTREFWYSPDLQVNLAVTRKDPREGTQVIHVVDLSLSDPDPKLFEIPAGFVVQSPPLTAKPEN